MFLDEGAQIVRLGCSAAQSPRLWLTRRPLLGRGLLSLRSHGCSRLRLDPSFVALRLSTAVLGDTFIGSWYCCMSSISSCVSVSCFMFSTSLCILLCPTSSFLYCPASSSPMALCLMFCSCRILSMAAVYHRSDRAVSCSTISQFLVHRCRLSIPSHSRVHLTLVCEVSSPALCFAPFHSSLSVAQCRRSSCSIAARVPS